MSGQPQFITFDLSGILAVPQSLKVLYQSAWNDFERIQAYNWNISTMRSGGDKEQIYYVYYGSEEMNSFTIGRFLHIQRYPASNWTPVSKD
jgi:hypothetical protein